MSETAPPPLSNEHLLTPATLLTASRPVLGLKVAHMLTNGERGTAPWAVIMGLSDLEGGLAKAIDALFPNTGYGATRIGAALDPVADTIAGIEVSIAALFAPRVSTTAKLAAGIMLISEGIKTAWAMKANLRHRAETGEQLIIRPGLKGKVGTASKLTALAAAVGTHELEPGTRRTMLGWGALGLVVFGALMSEAARRDYQHTLTSPKITTD